MTPFEFYLVCDSRKVHVARIFRIRQMDIGFVMLHAHANDQPLIIIYSVFKQEAGSHSSHKLGGERKEKKKKKKTDRVRESTKSRIWVAMIV